MSNLRIIGLIIGILGLLLAFKISRGQRWHRFNFVLTIFFSLTLAVVSLEPNVLNVARNMLALEDSERGRIIALLIGSNIILWLLLIYFKSAQDIQKYKFDLLVRKLGVDAAKAIIQDFKDIDIGVLIPAYNEADNLKELLGRIPRKISNKKLGVLVIDDGSIDNTQAVVRQMNFNVISNPFNRGGGASLRLGYDILRRAGVQICVTMDADGQHRPEEIAGLVTPILEDRDDFVIGSRVLGKWEKEDRLRVIGLYIFNSVINLLLKTKITDCSSGFRAFKVNLLASIVLKEDQYHTSELIIDAARKGLRIGEVPVTILKRRYGKTKKGKNWKYALNFAKAVLKTWWRQV